MLDFTPLEYVTKIQQLKYKTAVFPILLVIISFGLNFFFALDLVKYLTLIGLVWYIIILMIFRIKRNYPPLSDSEIIVAPIYGKISKIEGNVITITKSYFQPADLRYSGVNTTTDFDSTRVRYFEADPQLTGRLIGVVPAKTKCTCEIPIDWGINVNVGEKVVAGGTILAMI
ncbi:MAG: hypothetical protein K9N07_00515 [Candidatus Cloacimonetes bacterium]|nr:hypothetical protein [Candidatus Cloacimonadota bacterium]